MRKNAPTLLLCPLLLLAACEEEVVTEQGLTGVNLSVRYDVALQLDQISVLGSKPDGTVVFGPERAPDPARSLDEGNNSLVILLKEDLAGQAVLLEVEGLSTSSVVAVGETTVRILAKQLISAVVTLEVPVVCGDGVIASGERCDDGNSAAGDGCGPGCQPEPGYLCTGEPSSCSCDTDVDQDGTTDCEDDCIDMDGDGYGEPGASGDSCAGRDCDEGSASCNSDCGTDVDQDLVPDCGDDCIDMDGDGYGEAGGGGNACSGPDCDDDSSTCTTDCTTDLDQDQIRDCADACLDLDGDGFGSPGGLSGGCQDVDCDDSVASCTTDCSTDLDGDSTRDCEDSCIDEDGDGYGSPFGALTSSCVDVDCDDGSLSCTTDCSTDVDADTVSDCKDTCIDRDGDGYGIAGGGGNSCTGSDCDDGLSSCTTDCSTDLDQDGTADCRDSCLDRDGDGYGSSGSAGNTCVGPDCNDSRAACTTDCSTCLPSSLTLSAQSPTAICGSSNVTIDLAGYDAAAQQISCSGGREVVLAAEPFTGDTAGVWSEVSDPQAVLFDRWNGGFPAPQCNGGGDFRLFEAGAGGWMQLGAPLDVRGYASLALSFRAGFRDAPGAGENLEIEACCGIGCAPAPAGAVFNAQSGGQDECAVYSVNLPPSLDGCASAMIRFAWPSSGGATGVDDVELTGDVLFTPITDNGGGFYRTTVTSCVPNTFDIQCVWDDGTNPPLSDSGQVVFQ